MPENIRQKIDNLEREIKSLRSKLQALEDRKDSRFILPYSKIGLGKSPAQRFPTDISAGLGGSKGSFLPWNDLELVRPGYGTILATTAPAKAYHKHSHSEYSGGALDVNTLKLVEYDTDGNGNIIGEGGTSLNRHCQQFWKEDPVIAKTASGIEKIGLLDIEFDEATQKWLAGGKADYIDVENTYLVQYAYHKYDDDGNLITTVNADGITVPVEYSSTAEGVTKEIKIDDKGNEMKAPLLVSDDSFRSNVIWDEDAQTWRFYAVFRPWEE